MQVEVARRPCGPPPDHSEDGGSREADADEPRRERAHAVDPREEGHHPLQSGRHDERPQYEGTLADALGD